MDQVTAVGQDCGVQDCYDAAIDGLFVLARGATWVAVSKPSGMLVHRGWARDGPIAVDVVAKLIGEQAHPIHRLDRATSGVLLMSTSAETTAAIQATFAGPEVVKRYVAFVRGKPAHKIHCEHPLRRLRDGQKRPRPQQSSPAEAVSIEVAEERLAATTTFETLWTGRGELHSYSLVSAILHTGRTHQIRRHLKHLSHPIVGDAKYGKGLHNRWFRQEVGLHRLALHAASLRFTDPDTGDSVCIDSRLPPDLVEPLAKFGLPCEPEVFGPIGAALFPRPNEGDRQSDDE